jgi:ParB-like chromosome segregation protein Spo0J
VRYPIGAKPAPADAGNGFRDEHSGKRLDHSLTSTTLRHQADRPTTELLPLHPLGELFPPIEGDGFKELVASIKANGLRDPIIVHDGMVLDGRNRQRACQAAGVDCDYQPLPAGQDPLAFVLDKNLNRRHLTNSQRAMVAAKLANLKDGQTKVGAQICAPVSQEDAAEKLKVSRRSVQSATKVKDDAIPQVIQAVERGDVTVSAAAEIAELPKADQRKVVAKGKTAIKTKAKKLRVNKQKRRAGRRNETKPALSTLACSEATRAANDRHSASNDESKLADALEPRSPDEHQLTKRAKPGAKELDASELAFRVSRFLPPYQDDLETFVEHRAELTKRNALVEALRHLAGECEAWATKLATDSETTSDGRHDDEAPSHSTDNEMVADPKKDGIPIFLQTQNRRVGHSAKPAGDEMSRLLADRLPAMPPTKEAGHE